MKYLLLLSLLYLPLCHAEQVLRADYRERPPEMQALDALPVGPLIEVLDTAARRIDARIEWRYAPFARSLKDLKTGRIDLVPRVLFTVERTDYVHFLPSIGSQNKSIRFIVRSGQQSSLISYADLYGKVIGVKRGTAYFEKFDGDNSLQKSLATDDYLLAGMFRAGRLDVMVVLDAEAIEAQFHKIGFSDYSYADYQYEHVVGNYYGASKRHYQGDKVVLYEQLGEALRDMRESGEIARIYHRFGVAPPEAEE